MATPFPPFDGSAPKRQKFSEPPEMGIDPEKRYTATMSTSMGDLVIALDAVKAPATVNNFVFLALHHYYDGVIFHRIINGFMCQGGDPDGHRSGRPRVPVRRRVAEGRPVRDRFGGDGQRRPDTNGSQFFLISGKSGVQLPPQYTLFGKIVKGLESSTRCNACRRAAATGRRPTSSSTRSPSPSPTDSTSSAMAQPACNSRSPAGASYRARRPGLRRCPADRADRPPPPASRVRPDRSDPDRLGERPRAQPGVATVRPPRAPPADPDRRRQRRRRGVRVRGARGLVRAVRRLSPLPMVDAHAAPVAERSFASRETRPDYIEEVYRRVADNGPVVAGRAQAAGRPEGHVVGLGRRQDRARGAVPLRDGSPLAGGATTSPVSTTSPSGRCRPTCWRGRRCPSTRRARSCSCAPPSTTASARSRISPTTTASANRRAGR